MIVLGSIRLRYRIKDIVAFSDIFGDDAVPIF